MAVAVLVDGGEGEGGGGRDHGCDGGVVEESGGEGGREGGREDGCEGGGRGVLLFD